MRVAAKNEPRRKTTRSAAAAKPLRVMSPFPSLLPVSENREKSAKTMIVHPGTMKRSMSVKITMKSGSLDRYSARGTETCSELTLI